MTDEDERMNRAKRIREMREGNRGRTGTDEDSADDTSSDEGTSEDEDPPEAEDSPEADEGSETNGESEADESTESAAPTSGTGESAASGNSKTGSDDDPEKQTIQDLVEDAAESADGGEQSVESTGDGSTENDDAETIGDAETNEEAMNDVTEELEAEPSGETKSGDSDGDVTAALPDSDTLEQALEGANDTAEVTEEDEGAVPAGASSEVVDADETATDEEETRVLEFTLDDEHYCLDIEYIEEIVKQETITRVPNTPEYVEGVVDLRGQITTILNPKVTLDKENTEASQLIVVFDSEAFEDQGHIGWVVDDVRQVSPIVESEVNDPPMEADYIHGVIDRDDDEKFVIWTSPDLALEEAE